jgi:hypothetical protein
MRKSVSSNYKIKHCNEGIATDTPILQNVNVACTRDDGDEYKRMHDDRANA